MSREESADGVTQRRHEWHGSTPLSLSVVEAVADATASDPLELDPLYGAINPDGLNAIFLPAATGASRNGQLSFPYAGRTVSVSTSGVITVEPTTDPD